MFERSAPEVKPVSEKSTPPPPSPKVEPVKIEKIDETIACDLTPVPEPFGMVQVINVRLFYTG
jgi:hypothetical protein